MTEEPKERLTERPTEHLSENLIKESSYIQKTIPDICSYVNYLNISCTFSKLNKEESYNKLKKNWLRIILQMVKV